VSLSSEEAAMKKLAIVLCVSLVLAASTADAGPADDVNAVIDRWAATYSANDREALVKLYAPDAVLLGTESPVISEGREAIYKYFSALPGSGRKNSVGDRRTIVLSENAIMGTGFYEFTRIEDGKPIPRPARFTMVVVKRDGEWLIVHHHSSLRSQPK
jgi:uncharacterized protein (TIGR02246 family)